MKLTTSVILAIIVASSGAAFGADARSAMGSTLRLVPRQRRQRQHHDGKKARCERLHQEPELQ